MYQWLGIEHQLRQVQEQELERRLEIGRLLADARLSHSGFRQSGFRQRVLLRLSDALIATGERLRQAEDGQSTMAEAMQG